MIPGSNRPRPRTRTRESEVPINPNPINQLLKWESLQC
jgi:hypothetical protein